MAGAEPWPGQKPNDGRTGALPKQIDEAVARRWPLELVRRRPDLESSVARSRSQFEFAAQYLVPPGHRIVGPDDEIEKIRNAISRILDAVEDAEDYLVTFEGGGYPDNDIEAVRNYLQETKE